MYVLSQISVRFALRGFVSEKKNEKKVKFSFFWHLTCSGYLKFSSVSLYEASFPRKKKKTKIFIFLTFNM